MNKDKMLSAKNIKTIVVHCSDTSDDDDIKAIDIHKMHLGFGWDGIGYHKVICRDGLIENGRPEFWIGAHVKGKNSETLGVCLIGRKNFTIDQFLSLEKVLIDWKLRFKIKKIMGHKDITNTHKTCPNFNVNKWCVQRGLL